MAVNSPVVLLVDDHPDSVEMYTVSLLLMGFQAVSALNAEDGFTRACESHPDVVVTDMTLAGASGLDLMRRLRDDARTKDAGMILLTGHAAGSTGQEANDAGCDRVVLKPCLPEDLAVQIRALIVARRTAA